MQVKTLVTRSGIILGIVSYIIASYCYSNPKLYENTTYETLIDMFIFIILLYGSIFIFGTCCHYINKHWDDDINLNKFK